MRGFCRRTAGSPHDTQGRRRHEPGRGFDERETTKLLQDFVKAKLLPYKYPREIRFTDELPKTGTGKIDRQAVMRM